MDSHVKYAAVNWDLLALAIRCRRLRGAGVDIRFRRQ